MSSNQIQNPSEAPRISHQRRRQGRRRGQNCRRRRENRKKIAIHMALGVGTANSSAVVPALLPSDRNPKRGASLGQERHHKFRDRTSIAFYYFISIFLIQYFMGRRVNRGPRLGERRVCVGPISCSSRLNETHGLDRPWVISGNPLVVFSRPPHRNITSKAGWLSGALLAPRQILLMGREPKWRCGSFDSRIRPDLPRPRSPKELAI